MGRHPYCNALKEPAMVLLDAVIIRPRYETRGRQEEEGGKRQDFGLVFLPQWTSVMWWVCVVYNL